MELTPVDRLKALAMEAQVIEVLRTCHDPEIPVDIYELGLVYGIDVDMSSGHVGIRMTLTSPNCPVAGSLPQEVKSKVEAIEGIASANVEIVWDPTWTPALMSEAAKLQLNMY